MNTNFSNLGLNNINNWIEPATEIGLAAACIPFNQENSSPIEYYQTSSFITSGKDLLDEVGVVKKNAPSVPVQDQLLYHALLFVVGSGIPHQDYIVPFLAAPSVMRVVCNTGWFSALKTKIGSSLLDHLKNRVIGKVKELPRIYFEKKVMGPIKTLILEDKSVLLENLRQSCLAALIEKREAVETILEDSEDVIETIPEMIRSGIKIQHLEHGVEKIASVQTEIKALAKTPKITPFKKEKKMSRFLRYNVISVLSSSSMPQLSILALTPSAPDATELLIRLGGAITSRFTGYPMMTTLVTELVNAKFPKKWRSKLALPAVVGNNLQKVGDRFRSCLNDAKECGLADMKMAGFSNKTIKHVSKVVPQTVAAHMFIALFTNNHPLANAFSATSFIEYMGTLGEYHGLVKSKSLESENTYLDRFPLQAGIGMALTGLESAFELPRPASTLIISTLAIPLIADRIVNSNFYQTKVLVPIKQAMIPKYDFYRRLTLVSKMDSFIGKPLAKNAWVQKIVILTASVKVGLWLNKPKTRNAIRTVKDTAIATMQVYNRYNAYSTLLTLTGSAYTFAVTSLVHRNVKGVITSTVGVTVGLMTEDPLTAAIAVGIADTVLDANKVQSTFTSVAQKCTGFFRSIYQTISDVIENEARMIQDSVA